MNAIYSASVLLLYAVICLNIHSTSSNIIQSIEYSAKKSDIELKFENSEDSISLNNYRELSYRYNRKLPALKIEVRDKLTGKPLVADLIIQGIGNVEGVYYVSDLIFDNKRNGSLSIFCERPGYFYFDTTKIQIQNTVNRVIRIELDPVTSGKSFVLDGIEFVPGTSTILEKSKPKLNRLVEFLKKNPSVCMEIQGHVYEPGSRASSAGQKTSMERATRVMNFLINSGIDPMRLTAAGLGNSKPAFMNPRNLAEEQANRRVEFVIK